MSVQQGAPEGSCEAVPTDGFTTVAEHSSCAARGLAYDARGQLFYSGQQCTVPGSIKRRDFDYFKIVSIRASSCSENSRLFSADTESSICSGRLAPISALVTTSLLSTQARAICASRSEERRVGKE